MTGRGARSHPVAGRRIGGGGARNGAAPSMSGAQARRDEATDSDGRRRISSICRRNDNGPTGARVGLPVGQCRAGKGEKSLARLGVIDDRAGVGLAQHDLGGAKHGGGRFPWFVQADIGQRGELGNPSSWRADASTTGSRYAPRSTPCEWRAFRT